MTPTLISAFLTYTLITALTRAQQYHGAEQRHLHGLRRSLRCWPG